MKKEEVKTLFERLNSKLFDNYKIRLNGIVFDEDYSHPIWLDKPNGHIDITTSTIHVNWNILKKCNYFRVIQFLCHEFGHFIIYQNYQQNFIPKLLDMDCNCETIVRSFDDNNFKSIVENIHKIHVDIEHLLYWIKIKRDCEGPATLFGKAFFDGLW